MIEREFVEQKMKEYRIQEYISDNLKNVGHSHTKLQRTPLGEKIIVFTSRPGLIVGRKGQNINKLTASLKKKFGLENPQIEISEVEDINLDAQIVAERIASSLERFGSRRFKAVMHKVMEDTMNAGALGIEIVIAGKVPSARAKSWRVFNGYLKKCGDIAKTGVRRAQAQAKLKSGVIGIKVSITPADIKLPDDVKVMDKSEKVEEEKKEEIVEKPKKKKAVKKRKDEDKAKGA
jgi:small subunit ribosomal protein S3